MSNEVLPQSNVEKWLQFLDLTQADWDRLREIHAAIRPLRERIIEEFYEIVLAQPELAALLTDPATLARLKFQLVEYICSLLTGERNAAYVEQRFRIGVIHHRVGLESRWFLNAYFHLEHLIARHFKTTRGLDDEAMHPFLQALHRAVTFDTSLTVDAYVETLKEELKAEADQAREANRMKSEFLSRMSHELRTPLSSIINFTDYVRTRGAELLPPRLTDRLDRVLGNADHLLVLINDILDMSRIEAGRMELHPEWMETAGFVSALEALCEPLSRLNRNRFVLENQVTLTEVYTDPVRLRQILLNLLHNAFKFTHDGTVRMTLSNDPGRIRFFVHDTGEGIAKEHLGQIFEEFRQAGGGNRRNPGGTGLGLAISQQLCNLMGGHVEVESELGVGSTFSFSLPLALWSAGDGDSSPERLWILRAGEAARLPPRAHPGIQRVLAIDDDPDVLIQLQDWLPAERYQVVGCLTPADGEAIARAVAPDVILMDILFSEQEEWGAIETFRGDPQLGTIPMVILSQLDRHERARALGVAEFLIKPLAPERLKAVLEKLAASRTDRAEKGR